MTNTLIKIIQSEIFWTIISGTIVFGLSQYLMITWVEPLKKYKKLKEEISVVLVEYAPYYSNALQLANCKDDEIKEKYSAISDRTRNLASLLRGFLEVIPFIHFGIPNKKKLYEASGSLIGLSNGLCKPYNVNDRSSEQCNFENIKEVRQLLKIYGYKNE